jgi:hypothetical protein
MTQLAAGPAHPFKPHHNTAFSSSIQALVNELDGDANRVHSIPNFCRKFQVKRRRLYDVINVFTAIGCASRQGVDEIIWQGLGHALAHLKQTSARLEIQNLDKPLAELFPPDNCVGLPSLTMSFVLLFGALHMDSLDLRAASCFFSRNTVRYKSTLCKLYQIALILGALGVIERTANVCEVKIKQPFGEELKELENVHPLCMDRLLNRPGKNGDGISRRKAEYEKCSKDHIRGQ